MYIYQKQLENLKKSVAFNKVVVIYGPRRSGKTTLIKKYLEGVDNEEYLLLNGEDIVVQENLSSQSVIKLKNFIGEKNLIVIDEAQKIKNIGLNLKLIVDEIEKIKVIATGSSAFDLASELGEPLTGRKVTLKLFPLAQLELSKMENRLETETLRENRLIYGSYPEVVTSQSDAERGAYLRELINSYLFKDILAFEGIRQADKLTRLVQLLAFQIGKEVSLSELGGQIGISKNTVEKYLDLLQKTFVIYKLNGFSRNLRKEISKNARYYFYDNGVRNGLINNFNPLALRDDAGMLWENYVITERIKKQNYVSIAANNYFWRTYDQKEIDFIEEREGKLHGYEIKWGEKKTKEPREWSRAYQGASYEVITQENYLEFIG